MKIAIISGGFDPIHKGHIELINKASAMSDMVICILNSDEFLIKKKGYYFHPYAERKQIMEQMRGIDLVVDCIDKDSTVKNTLIWLYSQYHVGNNLMFCNGGDRMFHNIPEARICDGYGIELVDRLGSKLNSSQELVRQAKINAGL